VVHFAALRHTTNLWCKGISADHPTLKDVVFTIKRHTCTISSLSPYHQINYPVPRHSKWCELPAHSGNFFQMARTLAMNTSFVGVLTLI
jgi:hypothetical protein